MSVDKPGYPARAKGDPATLAAPGDPAGVADSAAKALFALVAWPVVLRASLRAWWWMRRLPLDAAVERLRTVSRLPGPLRARPRWLAALADRLLPVLPPPGYGPCMKRSLLLLDLWARCGLEPELHLGMQLQQGPDAERRDLHAWITAGPLSTPSDHDEIWCG